MGNDYTGAAGHCQLEDVIVSLIRKIRAPEKEHLCPYTDKRLSTGLFASAGQICWNRFTGPGKAALQSMYLHIPSEE